MNKGANCGFRVGNLMFKHRSLVWTSTRIGNRYFSAGKIKKFKPVRGTGDSGVSQLFNGEKRNKSDVVFEALGSTDELNSHLGLCRCYARSEGLFNVDIALQYVQCCLQDLASVIATPQTASTHKLERVKFDDSLVQHVDDYIDTFDKPLPKLKNFILPGGSVLSCNLHVARSVCRRAERTVVHLATIQQLSLVPQQFLNRTSDLLFVLARYASHIANVEEEKYVKPK